MRYLAGAYAFTAILGTVLAIKRNEPAAPLRVRTGHTLGFDATIGYGTALSAPWPMLLLLLASARGQQGARNRKVVQVLSVVFLVGAASEPLTWHLRDRSNAERAVVLANLAIPSLMWMKSRNRAPALARCR